MTDSIQNDYKNSPQKIINLIDILKTIYKNIFIVAVIVLAGMILSIIYAKSKLPVYNAKATFFNVSSENSSGIGNLNQIASLTGISLPFADKSKIDFQVILTSRAFNENLVIKHNLLPILMGDIKELEKNKEITNDEWISNSTLSGALEDSQDKELKKQILIAKGSEQLKGMTKVTKSYGLYTVEVEFLDPFIAAQIANAYVNELENYLLEENITIEKKTRLFIKKQLETTNTKLEKQELILKNFSEEYGILNIENYASSVTSIISSIKQQIALEEVELDVNSKYYDKNSFKYQLSNTKLEALKQQLIKWENGNLSNNTLTSSNNIPLMEIPRLTLQFLRIKRELKIQQEIYEMLRMQYEKSLVQESKESESIQKMDTALPAEHPFKPNKKLIAILGTFFSLFLSLFLVFLFKYINFGEVIKQIRS